MRFFPLFTKTSWSLTHAFITSGTPSGLTSKGSFAHFTVIWRGMGLSLVFASAVALNLVRSISWSQFHNPAPRCPYQAPYILFLAYYYCFFDTILVTRLCFFVTWYCRIIFGAISVRSIPVHYIFSRVVTFVSIFAVVRFHQ